MECNVIVEETSLVIDEDGQPRDLTFDEDELIPLKCHLNDSDDEVNDDDFQFDTNAPERVLVGYNTDLTLEFEVAGVEELGNDDGYCPSEEELHPDNFSNEEKSYHFPVYDVEKEKYDPKLEVGKEFKNIEEFKQAVRNHGVATRHNFRFRPNDEERAQAICKKDNCKFRIWASLNKVAGCVQIKSKNSEHTCMRDRTNRHCTARYIAERYLETFKVDRDWKTRLIKKAVKDDLKLTIGDVTIWRARRYARILIDGSNEHQFGMLRSFAAEILRTNPGSTCMIAINATKFQGIYVCLEACKRGFMEGCRQLLGLDGCFLKGTFGGQMLVAVALDANDCIYPVAYAIVERENATTWRWFIRHIGEDLKIMNSNEWTFMTDRQKGLQNVIHDLYPEAEHRFCVRHMYTNFFRADFKGLTLRDYLWRAAKSTTIPDWKFRMDEIEKVSKAAHGWLMKRHPSEWSKAYFLTKVKSDIVVNNLCEVFNNVVLEDREKSILTMLIDIHISFMKRIQSRRDKMSKVTGPLCPKIQQKLMKSSEMAEGFEVDWSGGAQSYVKCSSGEYIVDLPNRTCACRRWDLTGIPCAHAIAAILDRYDEPWKYVSECYRVDTYLSCYENIINPINGSKLWPSVDAPPIVAPGWFMPKRGRKQKKRRRQQGEDVITHSGSKEKMKKRGNVLMTCSVCGGIGHNKRYHQRPDAPQEDLRAYDVECTNQERSSQINGHNLRPKLVPRRSNTSSINEVQPPPPPSKFHFMPTPGLDLTNAAQYNWRAPSPTENIPLQTMVEDLQHIEIQENAQKRAAREKNRRVVRGSVPFAPPRKGTHAATQ